jgi:hypothetical protein
MLLNFSAGVCFANVSSPESGDDGFTAPKLAKFLAELLEEAEGLLS